jgi:7,8-dihydro-6-hydroxymethylpterin-pyrophosphokinase
MYLHIITQGQHNNTASIPQLRVQEGCTCYNCTCNEIADAADVLNKGPSYQPCAGTGFVTRLSTLFKCIMTNQQGSQAPLNILTRPDSPDACVEAVPHSSVHARKSVVHPEHQASHSKVHSDAINRHNRSGQRAMPSPSLLPGTMDTAQGRGTAEASAAPEAPSNQAEGRDQTKGNDPGSCLSSNPIRMLDMKHHVQRALHPKLLPPLQASRACEHVTCPVCQHTFPVPQAMNSSYFNRACIAESQLRDRELLDLGVSKSSETITETQLGGHDSASHDCSQVGGLGSIYGAEVQSGMEIATCYVAQSEKTQETGLQASALFHKVTEQLAPSTTPTLTLASVQLQAHEKRALRKSAFSDSLSRCSPAQCHKHDPS